jgi:hypothetical protein
VCEGAKWEGWRKSVGSEQRSDVGSELKPGGLFQWLYGLKGHLLAASLPRFAQFAYMKGAPFLNQLQRFGRKVSFVNAAALNFNQRFVLAIDRMEPESAAADGDSASPANGARANVPAGARGNRIE